MRLRHADPIRTLYQRLVAAGKPPKVPLVACMRKPPVILSAIASNLRTVRHTAASPSLTFNTVAGASVRWNRRPEMAAPPGH